VAIRIRTRGPRPGDVLPGEAGVLRAAELSLDGESRGLRALWPFLGPAFIASVAYVDPGNFATNIAAGAEHGYTLLWVVLAANAIAMLVQSLSAKLGIATGLNLAEVCRQQFPRRLVIGLWLQAEAIAMATDLAEFVGAALGLHLLFGLDLLPAGILTGIAAFAILSLQRHGFRRLEAVIAGMVGVIVLGFAFQVLLAHPSAEGMGESFLPPGFGGIDGMLLAAGILGATVMPHVIYLHSALTQDRIVPRHDGDRRRLFRFERIDVVIALGLAGFVNAAMLVMAAGIFHARGIAGVDDLEVAYNALGSVVGSNADVVFGIALLTSGLSSSSIGTMAGQVVMQGFVRRQIPLFVRRAITMAPALLVLALGVNASHALVLSQVVLSFGIPFALVPLVIFTRDHELMGALTNRRATTAVACVIAGLVIALNIFLIASQIAG
jgi:manganese transport protein